VSRLENTPGLLDLIRLGRVMIDLYCASYPAPPSAIVLDVALMLIAAPKPGSRRQGASTPMTGRCRSSPGARATRAGFVTAFNIPSKTA
jgi:hypothetical protein